MEHAHAACRRQAREAAVKTTIAVRSTSPCMHGSSVGTPARWRRSVGTRTGQAARGRAACCSRLLAAEHTTGWARKGLAAGLEAGRWRLGDIAAGWDRGVGYEGGGRGRSAELRRTVSMPTESKRRGKKKGVQWKDATGRADGEAPARFMDGAPFWPFVSTPKTRLSDSPATTRVSTSV